MPCLPLIFPWDEFLIDVAGLFVESYIEVLGDITNDIHLHFVEDDPSLFFVRERADPHNSLLDHSFEFDMIGAWAPK